MDRGRRQDRDRRSGQERRQEQERRNAPDRRASLDRAQETAQIKQVELSLRAVERNHPDWCHAFREHVEATDQQLARRAATGVNARGQQEKFRALDATRWQSADAMATAVYRLERSPHFEQARANAERHNLAGFALRRPLQEVIGPGWRADVYGRSRASGGRQASQWNAASNMVAVYRRRSDGQWHLLTCYPEPGELRSRMPWRPRAAPETAGCPVTAAKP